MEPAFHHRFDKSPLLVPIPSQNNPVHALPTDFFKIQFNKDEQPTDSVFEMHQVFRFSLDVLFGIFLTPTNILRSWLRHCATSRKVAGSISDGAIGIFR
jgi:hypothetical protein